MDEIERLKTVTVCSKCKQASCWQGVFMCEESVNAGAIEMTTDKLELLELENPSYWSADL